MAVSPSAPSLSVRVSTDILNRFRAGVRVLALRVDHAVADAVTQWLDAHETYTTTRQQLPPRTSATKIYAVCLEATLRDRLRAWCAAAGWPIGRAVDAAMDAWACGHNDSAKSSVPRDLRRRTRVVEDPWFVILDDEVDPDQEGVCTAAAMPAVGD